MLLSRDECTSNGTAKARMHLVVGHTEARGALRQGMFSERAMGVQPPVDYIKTQQSNYQQFLTSFTGEMEVHTRWISRAGVALNNQLTHEESMLGNSASHKMTRKSRCNFESFEKISFATNTIMRTGAEVFPRRSSSTGVVPD